MGSGAGRRHSGDMNPIAADTGTSGSPAPIQPERRNLTMFAIILLILAVVVALSVLGAIAHILFSPVVLVAIAIVAWLKFRPHRSHQ
jgi:uncharacterized membrane protein